MFHARSNSRVLFYQLGLKQFGSMHKLVLDPPPSVQELVEIAIETEAGIGAAGLDAEEVLKVGLEPPISNRADSSCLYRLRVSVLSTAGKC